MRSKHSIGDILEDSGGLYIITDVIFNEKGDTSYQVLHINDMVVRLYIDWLMKYDEVMFKYEEI